jgi:hypothetical protein
VVGACFHVSCAAANDFVGSKGVRMMFTIEVENGLDIQRFSSYSAEQELVLCPGTRLQVVGVFDAGNGLLQIQLREQGLPISMMDWPEFSSSSNVSTTAGEPCSSSSSATPSSSASSSSSAVVDFQCHHCHAKPAVALCKSCNESLEAYLLCTECDAGIHFQFNKVMSKHVREPLILRQECTFVFSTHCFNRWTFFKPDFHS